MHQLRMLVAQMSATNATVEQIEREVAKMLETMTDALLAYDQAPAGDSQGQVRLLIDTITNGARKQAPQFAETAQKTLAVPGAFAVAKFKKHGTKAEEKTSPKQTPEQQQPQMQVMAAAHPHQMQSMMMQPQPMVPMGMGGYNPQMAMMQQQLGQQIPQMYPQQQQQQQGGYGSQRPRMPPMGGVCHRCKLPGHIAMDCPNPPAAMGGGNNGAANNNGGGNGGWPMVGQTAAQRRAVQPAWQWQSRPALMWQPDPALKWQRPQWQHAHAQAAAVGQAQAGWLADGRWTHAAAVCAMSDVDRSRPSSSEAQQTGSSLRLENQQLFNNNQIGPDQQREELCTCGQCGACLAGIDLLHMYKEQRESREVAKHPMAARLESQLAAQRLTGERLERQWNSVPIQISAELQNWEEFHRTELAQRAWWLKGDEEAAELGQQQEEQRGPVKSQTRLRDIVKGAGRRQFDRDLLGPCAFCNSGTFDCSRVARGNGTLEKAIHSECHGRSIRQQHRETG